MVTTIVIVMAIYFLGMIGIGWLGRKNADSFNSYLNTGRKAGILLIMGGAIGGHIGNGFVVGGAGSGAEMGIGGIWYGIGCALSYVVLSFTINDYIYKKGYMSLADFLQERYGDKITSLIYSVTTALCFVGNMAAQIMAGRALFVALGLDGTVGAVVITVVVVLYSQISGLWGAFATSVVQTAIIMVGLIGTTVLLIANGGIGLIQDAVASGQLPDTMFKLIPMDGATFVMLIVPTCLAILTDQCALQRVNSAKSARTSKVAHLLSFVCMIPLAIMPAFVGMYAAAQYGVRDSTAFFTVILNALPPLFCAVLVAAVAAAVMSSIDCLFLGTSAVVFHDIYKGMINPNADENKMLKMTVYLNIIQAAFALIVALNFTNIVNLLSSTYSFFAASCLVPFVGGILWKKGTKTGAVTSSLCGVALVILNGTGILPLPYASVFPILPAVVVYVAVSLCTQKGLKTV